MSEEVVLLPVDEALIDDIRKNIGVTQEQDLGVIEALTMKRYARSVGETNRLYYDSEYARSYGYRDIIAPWNLLVSVLGWAEGSANEDLRVDGTEVGATLPGLPASGYRLMGGGEAMEFLAPVYPGSHLTMTTTLVEVEPRETRSGLMAITKLKREYFADGDPVLVSMQTILVR
ncbi:FAS1-like dehydratase domain-containing protein [Microbacterium gorillae]|uniref:FAS1-like dehydratase domain-containing protein n=1 Tax=Microbacterium gorillae TaxID=1231063 RepID=UPI0018A859CD|nr:MaoC family dehydratase N-terminal domain-containing protein [Microbacterium gorillae]